MRYLHGYGIRPKDLRSHKDMKTRIIGTSRSDPEYGGKKFVAMAEHKSLPFYMVQFHPEHIQFTHRHDQPSHVKNGKKMRFLFE